jgi:hypothetical protein
MDDTGGFSWALNNLTFFPKSLSFNFCIFPFNEE